MAKLAEIHRQIEMAGVSLDKRMGMGGDYNYKSYRGQFIECFKGASGKWRSQVEIGGEIYRLPGTFASDAEAIKAGEKYILENK